MDIVFYFTIFIGIILQWPVGRIFLKTDIVSTILAGMLVSSGIVSVLARTAPAFIKESIVIIIIIGFCKFFIDYKKGSFSNISCLFIKEAFLKNWNNIVQFIIILLFVSYFFRYFSYTNWLYESHDVAIFTSTYEILKADYMGNIRISVFYPFELAAYHILPSAFIAVADVFDSTPNLVRFIEARYILIILFFSNVFYLLSRYLNLKNRYFFPALISSLYIFGEEFSYSLTMSSFVYVFVLLTIVLNFFKITNLKDENNNISNAKLSIYFFSVALIMCKAPIFYIALTFAFFLFVKLKKYRFKWQIWAISIIVFSNVLTWVLVPKTDVLKESAKYSIVNPMLKKDLLTFGVLSRWAPSDNFSKLVDNISSSVSKNYSDQITSIASKFVTSNIELYPDKDDFIKKVLLYLPAIILIFPYIILKVYGLFFALVFFIDKEFRQSSIFKGFIYFMIVSLFGWIMIRNGGRLSHQAHAFLLTSVITSMFLCVITSKNSKLLAIVIPLAIFFGYSDYTHIPMSGIREMRVEYDKYSSLSYTEAKLQKGKDGFYVPKDGEHYWKQELHAMMSGLRLKSSDVKTPMTYGQIREWILGGDVIEGVGTIQ